MSLRSQYRARPGCPRMCRESWAGLVPLRLMHASRVPTRTRPGRARTAGRQRDSTTPCSSRTCVEAQRCVRNLFPLSPAASMPATPRRVRDGWGTMPHGRELGRWCNQRVSNKLLSPPTRTALASNHARWGRPCVAWPLPCRERGGTSGAGDRSGRSWGLRQRRPYGSSRSVSWKNRPMSCAKRSSSRSETRSLSFIRKSTSRYPSSMARSSVARALSLSPVSA